VHRTKLLINQHRFELLFKILSVALTVIFSEPYFKWNLVEKDADDDKFADRAIAGNADYLVTNDNILTI